jgi:hypothetical protein
MRSTAALWALLWALAALLLLPSVTASLHGDHKQPSVPASLHGDHKHPHPNVYKALYRAALLNGYGGVQTYQPHSRIAKETRAVTDLVKHWMSEAKTSHLCKLDLALLEAVNKLPYECASRAAGHLHHLAGLVAGGLGAHAWGHQHCQLCAARRSYMIAANLRNNEELMSHFIHQLITTVVLLPGKVRGGRQGARAPTPPGAGRWLSSSPRLRTGQAARGGAAICPAALAPLTRPPCPCPGAGVCQHLRVGQRGRHRARAERAGAGAAVAGH